MGALSFTAVGALISRRFRLGLLTLLAGLAGVALVVTTLSVLSRPEARLRWDISSAGIAGVSDRTAEALANLPEGARAIAFLRKEDRRLLTNADVVYPAAFNRLRSLLEDARIRARGNLEVVVLEEFGSPVDWNRWEDELQREPLEVLILDIPGGARRKFLFSELFLTTDPLPNGEPSRLTQERADAALGDAAIRLAAGISLRAGVVTGFGQPRTDSEKGLRPFLRLVQSEGIDVVEIPGPATQEEIDLLIVPGQTRPFLSNDAQAIRDWLAAGKPLFLALGPTAPREVVNFWNEVLRDAGLLIEDGTVCEARPEYRIFAGTSAVAQLDIPSAQLSGQHPVTQSLSDSGRAQGIIAARPLRLKGGSNDYLRSTLVHSSARAWPDLDRDFAPGPGEEPASYALAAAAERWQASDPSLAGRSVVLGSAVSLTGGYLPGMHEFVSGSLRWLAGQDTAPGGLVSLASLPYRPTREQQVLVTNLVTLGLPGFTLLAALLVFWRRRR